MSFSRIPVGATGPLVGTGVGLSGVKGLLGFGLGRVVIGESIVVSRVVIRNWVSADTVYSVGTC